MKEMSLKQLKRKWIVAEQTYQKAKDKVNALKIAYEAAEKAYRDKYNETGGKG